ncbi:MAG: prolyl oligopeptidase family serine peptidase [Microbacteriaceae bacterium]|nr:prolyl oligopeptidase family serine peptidase [Microbacteriaceae bacterium]
MRARTKWAISLGAIFVLISVGGLALGDYVYREGTSVPCEINADDLPNSPSQFFTPGIDNGPFPGSGWDKWVDYDLSEWWITDIPLDEVTIPGAGGVQLAAWWIRPTYPAAQETVIVTHGYGTSRRDYNALLPGSMLARAGFNVLLVDQRDTGESTCVDGRHSAGQDESDDFAAVADWLVAEKGISPSKIGMFGVSGGAIATAILPAKTDNVAAFALEAPIFDFAETARKEVEFQGFPGFLWQLADTAAKIRGVNLNKTSIPAGIEAAGDRPILLLHGTDDQRLAYEGALKFRDYAESVGVDISLETFKGSDHTEGMLSETTRYSQALTDFFHQALHQK